MDQSDDRSESRGRQTGGEQQGPSSRGPDEGLNRRQLLLLGGVATVGLFALTRRTFENDQDEHEVRVVLNLNAHTLETDDLEGHMDTLHPEAPIYNETEARASETIQSHNVTVELTVQTITVDNTTAEAEAVRTIRGGADDPGYEDVRQRLTYELQRHDGEWLIYNRTVRETEQPPADG